MIFYHQDLWGPIYFIRNSIYCLGFNARGKLFFFSMLEGILFCSFSSFLKRLKIFRTTSNSAVAKAFTVGSVIAAICFIQHYNYIWDIHVGKYLSRAHARSIFVLTSWARGELSQEPINKQSTETLVDQRVEICLKVDVLVRLGPHIWCLCFSIWHRRPWKHYKTLINQLKLELYT